MMSVTLNPFMNATFIGKRRIELPDIGLLMQLGTVKPSAPAQPRQRLSKHPQLAGIKAADPRYNQIYCKLWRAKKNTPPKRQKA